AGGLHDEDVARPYVGADLDGDLAVGKAAHAGRAQRNAQMARNLLREDGIGVAREHHEIGMWNNLHDRSQRLKKTYWGQNPILPWLLTPTKFGRGGRTRTLACWNQNPVP